MAHFGDPYGSIVTQNASMRKTIVPTNMQTVAWEANPMSTICICCGQTTISNWCKVCLQICTNDGPNCIDKELFEELGGNWMQLVKDILGRMRKLAYGSYTSTYTRPASTDTIWETIPSTTTTS